MTTGAVPNGPSRPWHALPADEVLSVLGTTGDGLSQAEARRRLEQHGPNALPAEARPGALRRIGAQLHNMLIYVLLAAAVFTAFMREWVDTAVILAVIVINAAIGFIQEGKAEKALESIRRMLSPTARVVRDGQQREIPAAELVPGDVVVIRSGDRVPADLRILEARSAQVEEAALTGESQPVRKQTAPVDEAAALGDRRDMAYSSTLCTGGQLRGVVVATGAEAEIGRISAMVSEVRKVTTPLLRRMDVFGRRLSVAIVGLSGATFAVGYLLRDFTAGEMFMAVVSLAVAAIPEGLPAIMTITLALGVQHMARRNAIVRRLPAVETLGSVTVACSDKTGTLTRNEMMVAKVAAAGRLYTVRGAGYEPEGAFDIDGRETRLDDHPWLIDLARTGLLASDARLVRKDGRWSVDGSPTEGALVVLGRRAGLSREAEQRERPRLDAIPFESERRYMASLHRQPGGEAVVYVKGAPERVLEMCARQRTEGGDGPVEREAWARRQDELAGTGHRVLAIATRDLSADERLDERHLDGLVLLGLVGMIDPPRQEAIEAVAVCRDAGIRVKMITGDHALTARSIASSMGIGSDAHVISGSDLEQVGEEDLARVVEENDVFARASPEHKLRMVRALQSRGQVVAMTGDGVNDAPALKRADVGVAMGIKGSEAAKEASEMVLADDNFATIERAVEEGRKIFDNLTKTILYILPTNGAQSLIVITAVLVAFEAMPVTPLQILWVNMVTAVTLALAFAFEPAEEGIMRRPPRPSDEPILSPYLVWRIAFVSILIAAVAILIFRHWLGTGASVEAARTAAVNTLVAGQLFYLFNSRFLSRSSLTVRALSGNRAALVAIGVLVVLQLAFTYMDPMQELFGTAAIAPEQWALALAAGLAVFLLVEVEKAVLRRRPSPSPSKRR